MVEAVGPRAARLAPRFDGVEMLICDIEAIEIGCLRAAQRRIAGDAFYGLVVWDEPRAVAAAGEAAAIVAAACGAERAQRMYRLGESGRYYSPLTRRLALEFATLVDVQCFFSQEERRRFSEQFDFRRRDEHEIVVPAVELPPGPSVPESPCALIWAPDVAAQATALLAFALEDWPGEVVVVCSDGTVPGLRARFVAASDTAEVAYAVALAGVIVDGFAFGSAGH